jgi:pimeloyl-ACP methyl ester carboxylesterase
VNDRFSSGSLTLAGHFAGVTSTGPVRPAVVIVHGYPSGPAGMVGATAGLPELADRIAEDMAMVAFAPCLRGMGESGGEFSIRGWVNDLHAAVAHVRATTRVSGVWFAGFGTGGAVAMCAAASDTTIRGVAALAAPADFDDWAGNPRRLVEHARETGAIRSRQFPGNLDNWTKEFREVRAASCAADMADQSLLVLHGSEDDRVPSIDARVLADAHMAAELRIIRGAGHRLRFDPRAMAILLGWLDRERSVDQLRQAAKD